MNLKALRRPNDLGRPTSQLTRVRRGGHQLPSVRPVTAADRLAGRWTLAAEGRLVLAWSFERSARSLSTPTEEAMPDPDAGPSHEPPARILGGSA
jgi:hypothetical protein